MAPGLQHITTEGWQELLQKIEDSDQQIRGISSKYVVAEKQFANELYESFIQGKCSKRPWLGKFETPEQFEEAYCTAVFQTLEKYLRGTGEQDLKRILIGLTHYFKKSSPHYFAIFPILEERIDKQGIYDAGDCYVRLSVLLPNGNQIPLATRGNPHART